MILTNNLYLGDNINLIKNISDNSIDLISTDPPYGLSMANWDKNLPDKKIWIECNRVLKPGAFLLVMSSARQDLLWRLMRDIEYAGFKVDLPSFYWVYAQGSPKGGNIHESYNRRRNKQGLKESNEFLGAYTPNSFKSAVEVVIFAMKPLSEKTYIDQALTNNKGIIWRDRGRIPTKLDNNSFRQPSHLLSEDNSLDDGIKRSSGKMSSSKHKRNLTDKDNYQANTYGKFNLKGVPLKDTFGDSGSFNRFFNLDWWWEERIKRLPEHVKKILPFFAVKKPSKKEKELGIVKEKSNKHVSVKPIKLMTYLIEVTTNKDDIVLDPFMGTGTTMIAAKLSNRKWIGFEKEKEYLEIAKQRIDYYE